MKKHYIIAVIIFFLLAWCTYAWHFEETPFEQNYFIGISTMIGFLPLVSVAWIVHTLFPDTVGWISFIKWSPIITGTVYTVFYLGIVVGTKYLTRFITKLIANLKNKQ